MNIIIMRHAEAATVAASDRQRELTAEGRVHIRDAAKCLQSLGFSIDLLWVSPYTRTEQSADELQSVYGQLLRQTKTFLTPDCNPLTVIEKIDAAEVENVLIISHQPLVSALVGTIINADPRQGVPMSPASMACISTEMVLPSCGTLKWLRHAPNYERAGHA